MVKRNAPRFYVSAIAGGPSLFRGTKWECFRFMAFALRVHSELLITRVPR